MKEFCGYKGMNGQLYEKKSDCEKADLDYKIKDVQNRLNNFSARIYNLLHRYEADYFAYNTRYKKVYREDEILQLVAKAILFHKDDFIEVINQSKLLKKELDELQKLRTDTWWLKLKWW